MGDCRWKADSSPDAKSGVEMRVGIGGIKAWKPVGSGSGMGRPGGVAADCWLYL